MQTIFLRHELSQPYLPSEPRARHARCSPGPSAVQSTPHVAPTVRSPPVLVAIHRDAGEPSQARIPDKPARLGTDEQAAELHITGPDPNDR
jgi:hypothetical protein